jgi:hypothetical protein
MSSNLLRLIALFVACVLGNLTVDAAEIRSDPSGGAVARAVLEGNIDVGDFEELKTFLQHNHVEEIYLASPGGNLGEAIRIGLLVRLLKLSTVAPSKALTNQSFDTIAARHNLKDLKINYMCASACFFVFVAGIHRSSDDLGPAILGIHRPFAAENAITKLGRNQAIAAESQSRITIENYLKAMDVPGKYAQDMYSVPKRMIQWIRNDEFESDFDGFIPELRGLVDTRCGSRTDVVTKWSGELDRSDKPPRVEHSNHETQLDCERKIQDELARGAYSDVLARHGGIPEITLGQNPMPPHPNAAEQTNSSNSLPAAMQGPSFPSSVRGPDYPQTAPLPQTLPVGAAPTRTGRE